MLEFIELKTETMKQILLLLGIASTSVFAQNIDNQRVSFKYEQKPLIAIDKSVPYELELDLIKYNQKSDDSIVRYEYLLQQFETDYAQWYEQKKKIDKSYLLEMSNWEKQRIASPTLMQPVKQAYPLQPFKEDVSFPVMLNTINNNVVSNGVKLEGFNVGQGGTKVIYSPEGLEGVRINRKTKVSGTTSSTVYTLRYLSPFNIRVIGPAGNEIFSENGGRDSLTYTIGKFDNEYEFEYWKIDNYDLMWKTVQETAIKSNLMNANTALNNQIGYPIKNVSLDIYTVKKHKGMDYSDFIKAYTLAKEGFISIERESAKMVRAKLKKAITIWETAEKESYIDDKRARVNKKVTAITYINLAVAYLWSDDFNKADYYIQKAINLGVNKYKNDARRLQSVVNARRMRFEANK